MYIHDDNYIVLFEESLELGKLIRCKFRLNFRQYTSKISGELTKVHVDI